MFGFFKGKEECPVQDVEKNGSKMGFSGSDPD
jgi:hypothetical protein